MSHPVGASRRAIGIRHNGVAAVPVLRLPHLRAFLEAAAVSYYNPLGVNFAPTLVIDVHGAAAKQLAEQLTRSGLTADSADTSLEAMAAVRFRRYWSMIFLGDLSDPEDVQCISELRKRASRTWIIMISSTEVHDARQLYAEHGVDAQIVAPFSVEALVSRLMALSRHSRPP